MLNFFLVPFILFLLFSVLLLTIFSTNYFFNKYYRYFSIYTLYLALITFLLFVFLEGDVSLLKNEGYIFLGSIFKQVQIKINLDGISLIFIFLTLLITLLCYFFNWDNITIKYRNYYSFLVLTCIFLVLAFSMLDIFLFYFFFESVVIPVFLLIGIWGSRIRRIYASYSFILYTLFSSLLMFLGILYFFDRVGNSDYDLLINNSFFQGLTKLEQKYLWLLFFFTFSSKIPMVPVHIWLPEAHVEAPTTGSVILASILLKLGVYGLLRYSLVLFPWGCFYYTPFIYCLSCISVVYASSTAIRQVDFKKIIAYASIAHMNIIVLGLFSNYSIGIEGAVLQSLSHGVVSSGLFFLIGIIYERYHTRIISYYSGIVYIMPLYSTVFFLFTLSNMGLPLTANFVGEFLILNGITSNNLFIAIISCLGMLLGAVYSLRLYNKISFGNIKKQLFLVKKDLNLKEILVLSVLLFFNILIGIWPQTFLNFIFEQSHLYW